MRGWVFLRACVSAYVSSCACACILVRVCPCVPTCLNVYQLVEVCMLVCYNDSKHRLALPFRTTKSAPTHHRYTCGGTNSTQY